MIVSKIGHQGVEHEAVLEGVVPPVVELEALLLLWWGIQSLYTLKMFRENLIHTIESRTYMV